VAAAGARVSAAATPSAALSMMAYTSSAATRCPSRAAEPADININILRRRKREPEEENVWPDTYQVEESGSGGRGGVRRRRKRTRRKACCPY
jgi:hypothetical protein